MSKAIAATTEMGQYCWHVVQAHLDGRAVPTPPATIPAEPAPIFVSFKRTNGHLRGCIGTFASHPLPLQLQTYSAAAAFEDSRFTPITARELEGLKCTVCILHSFEPARSWDDWDVGTHGIKIKFGGYGATYLPHVASEQGWSKRETLDSLIRKAGYTKRVDDTLLAGMEVTRYQNSEAEVRYVDAHSKA